MKNFLLELKNNPNAIIHCDTMPSTKGFAIQIGEKKFVTTPAETAWILNSPGFSSMTVQEKSRIILGAAQSMSPS